MHSEIFVANSDALNRYRMMFTIGALEDGIFQNAIGGIPALLSHDLHRPIGWNVPFGLYFEPKLTRLVGEYLLPESNEDQKIIYDAHHAALANRYIECSKDYIEDFQKIVQPFVTRDARYFYNGCVAYYEPDILTKIYPNLENLQDKDGLIFLSDLFKSYAYLGQGIFKDKTNNFAIFCHQYFRRNLSHRNNFHNHFLDDFLNEKDGEIQLRIALDFNLIGYAPSFNEQMELEYWWGPKYSDDIENISVGVTEHKCDDRQKLSSGISGTQFWWKNDESDRVLEVEELRDIPVLGVGSDYYGCRYVHSIFNNGLFSHFDGAIRMYTSEKMIARLDKPINKAGKNSEYTKLFRIDGKLPLRRWKALLTNYFQDNPLLYEYFGHGSDYKKLIKEIEPQSDKPDDEKLVPYYIHPEQGIKLFVTYQRPTETKSDSDVQLICLDNVLRQNGERNPAIEFEGLEIVKTLWRQDVDIEIPPGTVFTRATDDFINFPTILHRTQNPSQKVGLTLRSYISLFEAMKLHRQAVVSFAVAWPMEEKEVRLSVYGNINQVCKWLSFNQSIPDTHIEFRTWLESQKKWLTENYEDKNGYPDLFDLVKRDGILYMQRNVIDDDWVDYEETDQGLRTKIVFPEKYSHLARLLSEGILQTAVSYIVRKATCSKTGGDYLSSMTSKYLDNDVKAIIEQVGGLSTAWTKKL